MASTNLGTFIVRDIYTKYTLMFARMLYPPFSFKS